MTRKKWICGDRLLSRKDVFFCCHQRGDEWIGGSRFGCIFFSLRFFFLAPSSRDSRHGQTYGNRLSEKYTYDLTVYFAWQMLACAVRATFKEKSFCAFRVFFFLHYLCVERCKKTPLLPIHNFSRARNTAGQAARGKRRPYHRLYQRGI